MMAADETRTGISFSAEQRSTLIVLLAELEQHRRRWRLRELAWSWTRLFSFVGLIASFFIIRAFAGEAAGEILVAADLVFWVALFAFALGRHAAARRQRSLADAQCLVTGEALQRVGGQLVLIRSSGRPLQPSEPWPELPLPVDEGPTWALTDQERDDLDLYASPLGLFGLLNRTSTGPGARRLDSILNRPCLSAERIRARQLAVRWLTEHTPQRIRLMAAAAGLRGKDERLDNLLRTVHRTQRLHLGVPAGLLRIWGLISGTVITVGLVRLLLGTPDLWFLLFLAANMAILYRARKAVGRVVDDWRYMAEMVESWHIVAGQAAVDLPRDTDLAILAKRSALAAAPAVLPRLHRTLDWLNIGGAAQVTMNLLFLYDLQLAHSIGRQVSRHRDVLLESWGAAFELEAWCSLACFSFEQPVTCWPEFSEDLELTIRDGVHPLIPPAEVLPNTLHLDSATRTWIITGSNMSGKSTFLRMVGINLLLAQIGSAATARQLRLCALRLLTDLRARDNLARHESYYLAEVRQLRRMLIAPADEHPILGLVDEPFRGTNSEEQAAASVAVVQSLIESPHLFIVATHERRLTELADGKAAENFHFQETLEQAGMVFDYTLRPGPAHTRNAIRILQREQYPESIITRAAQFLEHPQNQAGSP